MIADMTCRTIQKLRDDDSFDLFWLKVTKTSESLDIEPLLPWQRKQPRRYEDGLADGEFHGDVKVYLYSHLEQLLLKASEKKDTREDLEFICKFYGNDLDKENLKAQLITFGIEFQRTQGNQSTPPDIFDIKKYFHSLVGAQRSPQQEWCKFPKISHLGTHTVCYELKLRIFQTDAFLDSLAGEN